MVETGVHTLDFVLQYSATLAISFVVFTALAKLMPCNPDQKIIRDGIVVDVLYGLVLPIISRYVTIFFLTVGFGIFLYDGSNVNIAEYIAKGHGLPATLPIWLQAAIVFILSDILLYWGHRIFHGNTLWKFHAIHHCSKHIDWLSAYRFHPINAWFTFTLVNVLMLLIGFSPESIAILGTFNVAYSYMVHANLNWTFGPFRYIFASPVFHRWHHTTQEAGLDKNFAPTFPLLDIIFGTFYMPNGVLPNHYGIKGTDIPESFTKQLLWPFIDHNKDKPESDHNVTGKQT